MIYNCTLQSPIGAICLQANDTAVFAVSFGESAAEAELLNPIVEIARKQLAEYFSGTRMQFDLPLAQEGSLFQQKVWQLLRHIPFGNTTSYQALSKEYGDLKAIRAIATANAKNRLAIFVPCHRVIGSDGSLTGFAWGLERKRWLLEHEKKVSGKIKQTRLF